ncbi:uncharacterized protein E0L32_005649 [Thyridium curvatum]|uniref:Uncharacterized protein n=1 Tax=Thyridium curvatum TaxID=1093900 RepID=A0A507B980_9PEZI|nr:uncharacterized protein E0L32_005649 [Thyridium curvatum]TPX13949.1 hypothetical protein E0L32_005649 [Thyridium curvatum]
MYSSNETIQRDQSDSQQNMDELENQEDGWLAGSDDVSLGSLRSSVWYLRRCAKLQSAHPNTAAGIHGTLSHKLGTDLDVPSADFKASGASKWKAWAAVGVGIAVACLFAGIEAALILTLRVFLGMDWSGAFVSLMALVAQDTFDVLGGVMYIVCCMLEIGIFTSHLIWRFRTRRIRKEAASRGKTFDDIAAEYEARGIPFKFAERRSRNKTKPAMGDEELSSYSSVRGQ